MSSTNLDEAILFLIGEEIRGSKLVSKGCVKALKAINLLFRNRDMLTHFYSSDEHRNLGFLITLTNVLSENSSLTADAAQSEVFRRYFQSLIPAKLKGFENVWMYTFEYHRSIEKESREVCRHVCIIMHRLLEYRTSLRRDGVSPFLYPIAHYLNESPLSGDFLSRIVKALDHYRSDSEFASWGLFALIRLVLVLDDNGDMGIVYGALSNIISSLNLHINDKTLMNDMCDMLRNLEKTPANIFKHLIYPPFCAEKAFVRILHHHPGSKILCANALRVIGGLLEERDCLIQDRFMEINVDKHVIALVTSHPRDAGIAVSGCSVLSLLAEKSSKNKRTLGENGACEAVMVAFSHHCEFRSQGLCRRLIRLLAYDNIINKNKLLQLGASDYVPQLNISGWLDGAESEQGGDY